MDPMLFRPIAFVRSPYHDRIDAPHQAVVVEGTESGRTEEAVILLEDRIPEKALRCLEGFQRIWVIFAFHRSQGWAPLVKPPRGRGRKGVLATRSPDRPNPIGLSALELVAVEGRTLRVRGVDLLDGTPILDIKPYVPYADAFPDSVAGWIDEVDAQTGQGWAPGPRKPRRPPQPGSCE
nr:tRNA (N6-threonylcarbamoyladenosine(37)-N6)-methyltransferase TrmO [uncultured Holophaga sp.]